MRIPQVRQLLAGVLVARQTLLPSSYCAPECPSCRQEVATYNALTSCVANSTYIQDCGHCQTCVMAYAIENGGIDSQSQVEEILYEIINMCNDTAISADVVSLQSQASLLSAMGKALATTTNPALASMTSGMNITPTPSASQTSSSSATSSNPSAVVKPTAAATAESISTPTASASPPAPLNPTWVSGPVLGSVLGISTVMIVIYFTRRRWRKKTAANKQPPKEEFYDDASNHSQQSDSRRQSKPQPATELESIEVYELPVPEPVGSELSTPLDARLHEEDWPVSPLPLSPLPLLFAMTEMRDDRVGNVSPKHNTFYHASGSR